MSAPVLEVRALDWGYGAGRARVQVLHGVGLEVSAGELVALVGPSGSGKSTICHLVSGLEPMPTHPERVRICGRSPARARDWGSVSVVPQQHGLLAGLTVRDNVALPLMRARDRADSSVDEALRSLDLLHLEHHQATAVSLGEQQRTALARALVCEPSLLVLDEPSGHQGADHVALVVQAVRAAGERGTAVLMATHDDDLIAVADRVVRLLDGRVV